MSSYLDLLNVAGGGGGGGGANDADNETARRIFQTYGSFYNNNQTVAEEDYKRLVGVTETDDLLTPENVVGNLDTGERVTPFLSLDVMLSTCDLKHPSSTDGNVLKNIHFSESIPANDIISFPSSDTEELNKDLLDSVRNQIKFGFDPITETLKNCITTQTLLHSFLKSSLLTLQEKFNEWGSIQLEKGGQEMALCASLKIMGQISALIETAKEASMDNKKKNNNACANCRDSKCSASLVTLFNKTIDEKYVKQNSSSASALLANTFTAGANKPPKEFITKDNAHGNSDTNYTAMSDNLICPGKYYSSDITYEVTKQAKERIKNNNKKMRLATGVEMVMKELEAENNKEGGRVEVEVEGVEQQQPSTSGEEMQMEIMLPTPPPPDLESLVTEGVDDYPVFSPLPSLLSPMPASPLPSNGNSALEDGGPFAPSADIVVDKTSEIMGRTPGSEWVHQRDRNSKMEIRNYGARGSGINTGRYRRNNTVL
ncbi:wsv131 [White spot syndrome virus]|uniref:Wsv131 n=10 Tax=White spot syndrome virus TaxID=342409 RepID=A0A0S2E6E0_9VIRU|nr:hypothetical protein [White spot syndrome virus]AWQ62037.1 wsv131 [Shrimp white spot syndrome virus]AYW76535.1 hypothetical protein [Procambarus clarkii virus]ALZ45733.1 hypothetical protein [White spot syndrome virus]ASA40397.1 wsv131 [White spot syndrome virus]